MSGLMEHSTVLQEASECDGAKSLYADARSTEAAISYPALVAVAVATQPFPNHFKRIPRHVGFIPDGNRRWAEARGWTRQQGYAYGIKPGLHLLEGCRALGIEEISIYGFTHDNVRRQRAQVDAFRKACVDFSRNAMEAGAALLAVGDARSPLFPEELRPYAEHRSAGDLKVNLLVNYSWEWDLGCAMRGAREGGARSPHEGLGSRQVSRIELIVRWGGQQRLSGFLPCQSAYADFFSVPTVWPDAQPEEFMAALRWYQTQDITMGG